tara:strand:- start:256 stop:447 length:192 start_codon:yes stop_codon:yes gene_type:complete
LNDLKKRLMKYDVKKEVYDEIAKVIHSDKSPVGIDAKKTHILILNKLQEITDRLDRIETKLIK